MLPKRIHRSASQKLERADEYRAVIKLRARELAEERGITNPFALSKESGVAYANCYKIWNNQQKMISLDTLDRLCEALRCESGDILVKAPTTTTRKAATTKSRR